METQWTPGPWKVHGDETQPVFYVHGSNAVCDIRKPDGRFYRSPRETEANARLIAAAPEMAELLERIALTPMQNAAHALDYIADARALLAKIKGTTNA